MTNSCGLDGAFASLVRTSSLHGAKTADGIEPIYVMCVPETINGESA